MKNLLIFCLTLLSCLCTEAQRNCGLWLNEVPLVADTAANSLYVTVDPNISHALKGTLRWDENRFSAVKLNDTTLENGKQNNFAVAEWTVTGSNTLTVTDSESKQWKLVFSSLPFLVIDCPLQTMSDNYSISKDDVEHYRKYPGYISVIDARCRTKVKDSDVEGMASFSSDINIRLHGATSGNAAKKSFNIELVKDGESNDAHLLGYRKDDDWLLAAEYTDYSRMRNRVIMDLWNSVDDLPYEKDNEYQCNGTQGEFVEVFVNGRYYGLMCFTDKIDRKKLNLKKTKEATATTPEVKRGLLWKACWECGETYLSSYDNKPTNDSFLWPYVESKQAYGWEQKFPDDTVTQAFFDPICDIIDLISKNASTTYFRANYKDKLYEQNVTDFILFIQFFQLLDNQKKNYYLSVRNHNSEEKFLFTLWDLDGSIGRLAGGDETGTSDGKQMAWGEKLAYHGLIHRFKVQNLRPTDFATTMNNRWQYLSTHQLSLDNIRAVMEKYANLFTTSGAWERERNRWLSYYAHSKKIAATPQEEVEFMMSFLKSNYDIFNQEMAETSWSHDEYNEEKYSKEVTPKAIYVVGNDVTSKHEDNTVILPGNVDKENIDSLTNISYKNGTMTVVNDDQQKQYAISDIKEVRTDSKNLYATPAFTPDSLSSCFAFDTRYGAVKETTAVKDSTFDVQRTVEVIFDGTSAIVKGNLNGITVTAGDSAKVTIATDLEGVEYLISGSSECGTINIQSSHPCKVAAAKEGALLSGITANCDITVNTPHALNFYNNVFDGKCINTTGDVTIEDGNLYFMMTGSGTLTDAEFLDKPELGARAIMANNITINGGRLAIKTLGHNGAVGLAAVKKITINGGNNYICTYDDPIKVGSSVTVNGGFTFTSSLTNDGLDSKGDIFVNGGVISTCGPEGAEAAYDVNHFYCNGGTVIGVGYKSELPMASKSTQAAFRLYKNSNVKKYVKVVDAANNEIATIETPAYSTMTIVYSSPKLQKGNTYKLLTGDAPDSMQDLTTLTAE